MQPVLRPARMCDAKKIHGLLMECSAEGLLLPRSLSNLYGQIRDFRILETVALRLKEPKAVVVFE